MKIAVVKSEGAWQEACAREGNAD